MVANEQNRGENLTYSLYRIPHLNLWLIRQKESRADRDPVSPFACLSPRQIGICLLCVEGTSFSDMMFAGRYVAPLFIKPEDTVLLAVSIVGMELFSLSYLTGWVDMCFSSYFTALERPARSMLTFFFGTLVFPILALCILTPMLELNGVWLSAVVACSASAIFTIILAMTMIDNAARKAT